MTPGLFSEWVKEIWDQDFTDTVPLQDDVEDEVQQNGYYCKELKSLAKVLKSWAVQEDGDTGRRSFRLCS
jgi:hypothetical protein